MKALVKKYAEPGIWMEDVPMPEVGVNDVLIKIWKVAICGTDLHIYNWDQWAQNTIKTPMTIGHEYVGEIVKLGSGVKNYKIRDRRRPYRLRSLPQLPQGPRAHLRELHRSGREP